MQMDETLKVKIIADTSNWKNSIDDIKKKTEEVSNEVKKQTGNVSDNALDILSLIQSKTSGLISVGASGITKLLSSLKDTSSLSSLSGIVSKLKDSFNGIKTALAAMSKGLKTFIGVAAGLIAVITMAKKIKATCDEVAQLGDEIDKTSQKLHMSAQSYQEWNYIMGLCGGSAEDLKETMNPMVGKMKEAQKGSEEAIAAFNNLGVSLTDTQGNTRDTADIFNDVITGLQGIENETDRTIAAQNLFGEGASKLAPLLNMSTEQLNNARHAAQTLGLTMSDNAVQVSAKYTDMKNTLKQATQSFKNTIGEGFMPVVTSITKAIVKAIAYISAFFRALFGLKQSVGVSSGSNQQAAKTTNNYTNSVNKATKAVKELKRQTMGFDEMNILQSDKSDSGSGGNVADAIADMGISDSDLSGFDSLFSEDELNKIDRFKKKMDEIRGWLPQVATIVTTLTGIVMVVIGCCTGNIPLIAGGIAVAGLGIAIGMSKDENGDSVFAKMGRSVKKVWQDITNWFKTSVAPKFSKEFWKEKLSPIKEGINDKLTEVKNKFSEKWTNIKDWFKSAVAPKFTREYWQNKIDGLKQAASTKINEVKNAFSSGWNSIKNWFSASVGKYFTVNHWTNKFSSIKNGMKNSLNSVIGFVESAVNKIVRKINTLSWSIPDWVPAVGGKRFGFNFNTVSIPRLATGGIVTKSSLVNVGEAGKEAVLPLESNTGWMDLLADRIAARNGAPSKIVLNVDGKELGFAAIKNINAITKQTGTLQLQLV